MNDRDRQNRNERGQQHGSPYGSAGYDAPRQANQWQAEGSRQAGGDWQQDSGQDGNDAYSRDYRFSGGQQPGSSSESGQYRSAQPDEDRSRYDQRGSAGNFDQDRGRQRSYDRQSQRQASQYGGYDRHSYDASGGNDFGSFTSEDFGGRDFYNRGGGGASGGMRSSESYRPSYGVSSWFDRHRDEDDGGRDRHRGGRDYGEWRKYGESRGFLERAGDEIASWFGDEDASRRREHDRREDHSGRGPSNYTRSDERIREDVNDHLTHDWGVDASHVNVSVKDGEVTLDGTVDSRQAKRRAEDCADQVTGVKHVQNNLRVQDRSTSSYASGTGGSSFSQGSGSGLTGSNQQAGSSGFSSSAQTGTTGGTGSSTASTSGANTTSGIGSTASAGVGGASAPRSSDKPS